MQLTSTMHVLTIAFTVPLPSGTVARSARVILICTDRVTLIDSGVAGAEQQIFAYLRSIGRRPEEIDTLILTHSHPDHIGGALAIVAATGCRVLAHQAERAWIENVNLQAEQRPVPGFHALVAGSVAVDRCLAHGDVVDVGAGFSLVAFHTPGHSAGSISLWEPQQGVVICGDAVPVAGDLPVFDDYAASLVSLELLAELSAAWLVSAWAEPLHGAEVASGFAASRRWLRRLHDAVTAEAGEHPEIAPLELCAAVVAAVGLPPFAVNPLVARSLMACLTQKND